MRPDQLPAPPRVFISYAHEPEAPEVDERVLGLANRLRADGVDARLDLHRVSPADGWPRWCEHELLAATFVLVVCTATYRERFEGEPSSEQGLGVRWEGLILRQLLYEKRSVQVIPVLLPGANAADIPIALARLTRRELPAEYYDLHRQLTGQPTVQMNPLGELRQFIDNLRFGSRPPVFEGREEELVAIHDALTQYGRAAVHPAIVGLGGVGKTRLALEYAWINRDEYDIRWRVRASSLASAQEDLVALGMELRILSHPADVEASVGEVTRWLSSHDRWLLLFDNAENAESIRLLLPNTCPGHVIITSRAQAWAGIASPIVLHMLPPDVARAVLLNRARQHDDGHVDALTKALGHLPLALVQAAAYIEATGESFGGYLELFNESGVAVFEHEIARPGDGEEHTVARTWALSFAKVEQRSPAAAALLDWLAFLDPDGVPLALLCEHPEGLPEAVEKLVRSRRDLNDALGVLRQYSLVDREGDVLQVHRLVQQVSREALDDESREQLASQVVQWVDDVFGYVPEDTLVSQVPEGIAEQVAVVAARPECQRADHSTTIWLLSALGYYRMVRGMAEAAKDIGRRALDLAEARAKEAPDHQTQRELSVSLNILGEIEAQTGDIGAACFHFQRALEIAEAQARVDPEDRQVQWHLSVCLEKLGEIETQRGLLRKARSCFQRALEVAEAAAKTDPADAEAQRDLAISLSKLGDIEIKLSRRAAVSCELEAAISQQPRARGDDSPQTMMEIYCESPSIASSELLDALGSLETGSAGARRNISVFTETIDGPDTPIAHLDAARSHLQRCADIWQRMSETDPNDIQAQRGLSVCLHSLGDVEICHGNFAAARAFILRDLAISEKVLEIDPQSSQAAMDLARSHVLIAHLAEMEGNRGEEREHLRCAHEILFAMQSRGQVLGYVGREQLLEEISAKLSKLA